LVFIVNISTRVADLISLCVKSPAAAHESRSQTQQSQADDKVETTQTPAEAAEDTDTPVVENVSKDDD